VEIWFNPACSKCRAARELLAVANSDYVVRRYLEDPPSEQELDAALTALGRQPWDITRLGEAEAAELGLADLPRERARWISILARHPRLIQRPILLAKDGTAWVGRSPDQVAQAIEHDR
jgi:arsenate reductase